MGDCKVFQAPRPPGSPVLVPVLLQGQETNSQKPPYVTVPVSPSSLQACTGWCHAPEKGLCTRTVPFCVRSEGGGSGQAVFMDIHFADAAIVRYRTDVSYSWLDLLGEPGRMLQLGDNVVRPDWVASVNSGQLTVWGTVVSVHTIIILHCSLVLHITYWHLNITLQPSVAHHLLPS
jgi:hypothetical protein